MGYLKMQGGEWLVAGRCSEPKYRRVGQDNTPRCTVGIAAGTNPKELDEQGRPKTIWINITAWREQADILAKARRGKGVLVSGAMYEREYNGQTYKGINAGFVSISPIAAQSAPGHPQDGGFAEVTESDGELPF